MWWSIFAGVGSMSCTWAQWPGQEHSTQVQCQHPRQRNKATEPAKPHPPRVASLNHWYLVTEHIICKPENWCWKILYFSEQRAHSVTGPGIWTQVGLYRCLRLPLPGGQSNLTGSQVTQAIPTPTHGGYTDSSFWLWGQHWDFMDVEPHCPWLPLQGSSWELRWPDNRGGTHLPVSTTPQRSENQRCARKLKTCDSVPPTGK